MLITILSGWAFAALMTLATVRLVYKGGRSLNDHAVAVFVTACIGVYPVLWTGLVLEETAPPLRHAMGAALGLGPLAVYGLFWVLERRVEAGRWMGLAVFSQPFYTFSLVGGVPLLVWMAVTGALRGFGIDTPNPLWPGSWLIIPLAVTAWATVWTYWQHGRVRKIAFPVETLKKALRVVHLSDVHASPCMTGKHLREMVRQTNATNPDVVLITGDHVMPFSEAHHSYLIDALQELKAPFYCCPGNHDLPILDRLKAEIEAIGGYFLVDESEVLELKEGQRLEIAGVQFHWKKAQNHLIEAVNSLPNRPLATVRLLLAHDPRLFRWLPENRFDLMLSGHTHGGQIGTDMFGLNWSVLRPFGVFDQGLFKQGNNQLYVHRGNWHTGLPPRIGIAAEIVIFDLLPAPAKSPNL